MNDIRMLSQAFVDDGTTVKYMVTKNSEIKTWQCIYKIANMLLEEYPTTLIEDDEILQKDAIADEKEKLNPNKRNCILYRKCEKTVLLFLMECANRVERLVDLTPEEAKEEVESWS